MVSQPIYLNIYIYIYICTQKERLFHPTKTFFNIVTAVSQVDTLAPYFIWQDFVLQISTDWIKENNFMLKKQTISCRNYYRHANDIVLLVNTPIQAKFMWHGLEQQALASTWTQTKQYICFKWGAVSNLSGCSQKLVDKFTYLDSSISSAESDVSMLLAKKLTAINR